MRWMDGTRAEVRSRTGRRRLDHARVAFSTVFFFANPTWHKKQKATNPVALPAFTVSSPAPPWACLPHKHALFLGCPRTRARPGACGCEGVCGERARVSVVVHRWTCRNTFLLLLCQSIGWPHTQTVSEERRVRTCAPLARARPMAATNREERMGSLRRAAEAEQREQSAVFGK
jgi:hypothetical protein